MSPRPPDRASGLLLPSRHPREGPPSAPRAIRSRRGAPGWESTGIPALSPWHPVKCQLSVQLCTPSRPSPVLVSSEQPLRVSMSHRAAPEAPGPGEENSVYNKQILCACETIAGAKCWASVPLLLSCGPSCARDLLGDTGKPLLSGSGVQGCRVCKTHGGVVRWHEAARLG